MEITVNAKAGFDSFILVPYLRAAGSQQMPDHISARFALSETRPERSADQNGTVAVMRVLGVEYEPEMSGFAKRGLQRAGYGVKLAGDGEGATDAPLSLRGPVASNMRSGIGTRLEASFTKGGWRRATGGEFGSGLRASLAPPTNSPAPPRDKAGQRGESPRA